MSSGSKPLPELVRDSDLETKFDSGRRTIHFFHDTPTTTRQEVWQREKKPIDRGAFGEVWLEKCVEGQETREPSVRAVKVMRLIRHGEVRLEVSDYARELETLAKFSRRKSYGWFQGTDKLCVALEYLPLGDLRSYLAARGPGGRLPEAEVQQIAYQLLDGLRCMHQEDFTHRDLKPDNILIVAQPPSGSWWVILSDFGLSKRIASFQTGSSGLPGTDGFMAPELFFSGEGPSTNCKAVDIWSVGEILFRMITGQANLLEPRYDVQLLSQRVRLSDKDAAGMFYGCRKWRSFHQEDDALRILLIELMLSLRYLGGWIAKQLKHHPGFDTAEGGDSNDLSHSDSSSVKFDESSASEDGDQAGSANHGQLKDENILYNNRGSGQSHKPDSRRSPGRANAGPKRIQGTIIRFDRRIAKVDVPSDFMYIAGALSSQSPSTLAALWDNGDGLGGVHIWDVEKGVITRVDASRSWSSQSDRSCIVLSPDSQMIAYSYWLSSTIRVANLTAGDVTELRGHESPITSLAFTAPHETTSNACIVVLASASLDKTVRLWPFFENRPTATDEDGRVLHHSEPVVWVSCLPANDAPRPNPADAARFQILSISESGTQHHWRWWHQWEAGVVTIWKISCVRSRSQTEIWTIVGTKAYDAGGEVWNNLSTSKGESEGPSTGVAFSQDDTKLAVYSDKTRDLQLWSLEDDEPALIVLQSTSILKYNLNGQLAGLESYSARFISPDFTRYVIHNWESGKVTLMSLRSEQVIQVLESHRVFREIYSRTLVSFSPDSRLLVTASSSGSFSTTMKLWDCQDRSQVDRIRRV
ncbi:Protein kinase-like domain containing protein [Rhypophila sp. PSN 637]